MGPVEIWYSVLTNGNIEFRLELMNPKWAGGTFAHLPDGVILGTDNKGNYYLNGKPAHIEQRMETVKIPDGKEWCFNFN